MADLLPSSSDVSEPEADEPRVVGVDSDAADDLLAALSSRTARRVLTELHEDPSTPARLAERVDTSLQNVQYHLGKLEDAGLVEVADTVYSEKGREMKVFAPADRALVVVAGREEETTGLKATLKRLLGSVGALGVASLLVDRLLSPGGVGLPFAAGSGDAGGTPSDGRAGGDGAGSAGPDRSTGAGAGNQSARADTTAADDADSGAGAGGGTETGTEAGAGTGTGTDTAAETPGTTVAESTATSAPTETAAEAATTTGETGAEGTRTATAAVTETPAAAGTPDAGAETAEASTTVADATATTARTVTETAASEPTTVVDAVAGSPGLVFFLGGLTALLLVALLLRR